MNNIVLESPYAGDVVRNIEYARKCLKDSLERGESPIASHLLYTQVGVLDDDIAKQRLKGISAGISWIEKADLHVFYIDYGMSNGMKYALEQNKNTKVIYRKLFKSNACRRVLQLMDEDYSYQAALNIVMKSDEFTIKEILEKELKFYI